jgi:hypothetical protein
MKRREFITLLGGGVVAWPRGARSQKPTVPRVGYIWIGARGTDVSNAGLRQGLTDLGLSSGAILYSKNDTLTEILSACPG